MHGLAIEVHADLLHDAPRRIIADRVHAHDPVETYGIPRERECSARGFGREALAPVRASESPADLDRGQNLGEEFGNREAGVADELTGVAPFEREEPEAALAPRRLVLFDSLRGVSGRHDASVTDEAHDFGIGADRDVGGEVLHHIPTAQDQSFGLDARPVGYHADP